MGFFTRKKSTGGPPPPIPSSTRPSRPPHEQPCQAPPPYHSPQSSGFTNSSSVGSGCPPPPAPAWPSGPASASASAPAAAPAPALAPGPAQVSPASHPHQHQQPHQQPQPQPHQPTIVVNQHYYVFASPQPNGDLTGHPGSTYTLTQKLVGSTVNLTNTVMPGAVPTPVGDAHTYGTAHGSSLLCQGSAVMDQICERFNDVMTLIDREKYLGNESKLFICQKDSTSSNTDVSTAGQTGPSKKKKDHSAKKDHGQAKGHNATAAAGGVSGNYFAKVELYANSRLPMNLPPLKLYIPTWPLLCLAAQYSERVYEKPRGKERDVQVDADFRAGTKAMVIKSVPVAHMNTIVFAIRGTATFMDWAVNLKTDSTSPVGFLDDYGNYCHAGFLSVARRMVKPVAARLRQLLADDPGLRSYSLLITGHSAGGAVAALLYSHMLSTSPAAASELSELTSRFKRVHCVTFGTPPVSLLPLQRPSDFAARPELRKSLFLSFVNEGDPVARADKAYVRSLLELFATPAPTPGATAAGHSTSALTVPDAAARGLRKKISKTSLMMMQPARSAAAAAAAASRTRIDESSSSSSSSDNSSAQHRHHGRTTSSGGGAPVWDVPPAVLSNAGRIVVLRSGDPRARLKGKKTVEERLDEGVVAQIATDEQLRTVVWGDPVCHLMKLYAGRLEMLAVNSVTAKGC